MNHTSDKGLILKICKECIQFSSKTNIQLIQIINGQRTWVDIFQRRYMHDQQILKKNAHVTHYRKMQKNHNEMSPQAIIKKIKDSKCWCIGTVTMENSVEDFQNIKSRTNVWSRNSNSGNISKGNKNTNLKRDLHSHVNSSIFYNHQDMETS